MRSRSEVDKLSKHLKRKIEVDGVTGPGRYLGTTMKCVRPLEGSRSMVEYCKSAVEEAAAKDP